MSRETMRWVVVAAVTLWAGASARAASLPSSGGPGALGTSVPYDSRLAREYFKYYLPTDTPEALRIRDDVQALHAAHQAVAALAAAAAPARRGEVTALARRLAEEHERIDWTLVRVAKDSLIELSGSAYDTAARSGADLTREVREATPAERDARLLAAAARVVEDALATVARLEPEAKTALRQQLGSVLARERRLLEGQLAALRAVPAEAAASARPAPSAG